MNAGGRTFAGRYALDVQVSTAVGTPVWRALDQSLRRWVTLYLMPRTDPRSPAVITSCLKVSANSARNSVAILDVIEAGHIEGIPTISPAADYLGIVTEWVEGESLDRMLTRGAEPFDIARAWDTIEKLAKALDQAHALSITHSRLRPHNVIFSDSGDVRIAGFGIESAILGPDRTNGVQADIIGLGNLLFAMTTGSWPNESVDGLPAAISPAAVPEPSSVAAGIPARVDRFFVGTQDGSYLSVREALAAMSIEASGASSRASTPRPATARPAAAPIAHMPERVEQNPAPRPSARERLKKLVPPALTGLASGVALGAQATSATTAAAATPNEIPTKSPEVNIGGPDVTSADSSAETVTPPRIRGSRIAGREMPPTDAPAQDPQAIVSAWFAQSSQATTGVPSGQIIAPGPIDATTNYDDSDTDSQDNSPLTSPDASNAEVVDTDTSIDELLTADASAVENDAATANLPDDSDDTDAAGHIEDEPSQVWSPEIFEDDTEVTSEASHSGDKPHGKASSDFVAHIDDETLATVNNGFDEERDVAPETHQAAAQPISIAPVAEAVHVPEEARTPSPKQPRIPRLARIPNNPVTGRPVTGQAAALSNRFADIASVDRITSHPPVDYATEPEDPPTRNRITAIALGAVVIFGWVGWQLLTSSFQSTSEVPEAIVVTPMTSLPVASPTPSGPTSISLVSATPFDPFGDQTENESESAAAIDADTESAWHTVVYKAANLGGKRGVGLVIDLGSTQKVNTVKLTFEAAGLDAKIFVSNSATPNVKSDKSLGAITNSNITETVTADKPIKGQYVLIWITGVPQTATGGYQGGVAEVQVLGP